MAKGKKPKFALIIIACVALYLPFQKYLATRGYSTAEDFFEDLLLAAILAAIVLVPAVILYLLLFKSPPKSKKAEK